MTSPFITAEALKDVISPLRLSCTAALESTAPPPLGEPLARLVTTEGDEVAIDALLSQLSLQKLSDEEGSDTCLCTGYYEPSLKGSLTRQGLYQTPLYRIPKNKMTRVEIMAGGLDNQGLELVWVDDPIDAFFLEIQGSGRITLDSGDVIRVGYAGQNGHPYRAIGKIMVEQNLLRLEEATMEGIKNWLRTHPDKAPSLMAQNPSYVYFKLLDGHAGPIGTQGIPLTEQRSLAVDPRYIPLGSLLYVDLEHPTQPGKRLQHFAVAQDTGGAIKGPLRADYFWGFGEEAGKQAGSMKSRGHLYKMMSKTI